MRKDERDKDFWRMRKMDFDEKSSLDGKKCVTNELTVTKWAGYTLYKKKMTFF